jgi:hypothetical protein
MSLALLLLAPKLVLGAAVSVIAAPLGQEGVSQPAGVPGNLQLIWSALALPELAAGARLGQALALGDFDGDGWQDLAASAPGAERPGGRGLVLVMLAAPGGLLEGVREVLRVFPPDHQPSFESLEFGAALCICELDEDPAAELLIGSPLSGSGSGSVFVWGIESLQKPAHMLLGPGALPGRLGYSLAVGDFDGDGRSDLAMGAPLARYRERQGGAVLLLCTSLGRRVLPSPRSGAGMGFGSALGVLDLAPGAAVNLVVAAPDAHGEGIEGAGQVWIYSAGLRPIQPTLLSDPFLQQEIPSSFGRSISALGKTLLIGAPDRESSSAGISGAAFRYFPQRQRRSLGLFSPVRLEKDAQAVPVPGSQQPPSARFGLRVLVASLLGGEEPDALVVSETFSGVEASGPALLLWPGADPDAVPIALAAPEQAGSRWMQSLAADTLNSAQMCLLAGDPSFDGEGSAPGSNRGRVMVGVLRPR